MRIAWIVDGDLAQPTGGYVYDRLVVQGLRALGDTVEVVDPNREITSVDAIVGDALCARELGNLLEHVEPRTARVLLVHHLVSWEVECSDHDTTRAIEARALAASHHVVVTSRATAARLAAEYPSRTIDVVVPGADRLARHSNASDDRGAVEVLFVGSMIPRKRLPMLLDAIEHLADPRLALTLVGDCRRAPEHADAIAARIDGSALLRGCVTVVGVVDDDSLAKRMARADALVLPSSLEGYGIVITEALHAGLPVLTTREAARATEIAHSDVALVFDDARELADALRSLVHDPLRRASMRRNVRSLKLPQWSETVSAFREVLTRAVARVKGREPDRAPSQL